MPATLRLYAYGPRPISPGLCAICSGVVCPIYTRRISIYSGVYLVRPGDVLYVLAYARYTPLRIAIRPVRYSLCLRPISLVMAGALRLLSTHPTHTGVFSEAMPLSESVAFHRKESDETPLPNRQTALASAIYTRVLQNREGRPPRARPCIRHLYPRTHRFSATFRTGFELFRAKTFSYHSQLFIFAKEEKSGTRKQQPPPHLFNRRNETVFRQNTGKAHRPTSPK